MISQVHVPDILVSTPLWLAIITTAVGAVEGAVIGRRSTRTRFDIVGTFVFAFFLGLGGGLARDLLLGNTPVIALRTPWYVLTVVAATLLVVTVGRAIPRVDGKAFILLDALTLGLYAGIGTQYALDFHVSTVGAIVVGMFASLTGGAIVSLLRRETPAILVPGSPYALLALAGVLVYLALQPVSPGLGSIACLAVVILLRFLTLRWGFKTHQMRPLPNEPE